MADNAITITLKAAIDNALPPIIPYTRRNPIVLSISEVPDFGYPFPIASFFGIK